MRITRRFGIFRQKIFVFIFVAHINFDPDEIFIAQFSEFGVFNQIIVHQTTPAAPFAADIENNSFVFGFAL